MKRKWRCDLKFWMTAYDRANNEQNMWIQENDWFYEHIGRPYSDEQKQRMFEITSRIMDMNDVKEFIRERILKYNI